MATNGEPVLVVGGRTTGLMMAAELARHGVPVRIIDKSPGIDPHSRATYLHARTLEILHILGVAEEIVSLGQPLKAISLYANGEHIATTPDLPVDSPFPWGAAFAQCKTEAILQRHLNRLGVEVERSTELLNLQQTDEGVLATIRKFDGSEETFVTPWLIGCDGAHSTVRRQIDEEFPGEIDPFPYLAADVLIDGPIEPDIAYLCLHDKGDLFIFLLDEGRRQIITTLPKNSTRTEPPTLEEMQQLIDERGFGKFRLSDPRWLTTYRTHYRLAPKYRQGRVLLAGDSAHVHSVIGGQGMNTGIQDAHNLAWKLSLVMRGVAPDWWLDTYESERRKIAADVIVWTKQANSELTRFAELSPEEQQRLCEHMVVPECDRMALRMHEEEIDLDYRSSRLSLEFDPCEAGPSPGERAPDVAEIFASGIASSLFETLRAPYYHLLLFNPPDVDSIAPDVVAAAGKALDVHGHWLRTLIVGPDVSGIDWPAGVTPVMDLDGELRRRYGGDVARLYLIRPDGYVAYRSQGVDGLDAYLQSVLK
ncbi:FAD-dependent monooxygenase [Blastopirellula sp. JC732]|uniref:FAD-dependent monooxygenase n=1 Tax=Blastopirellula sediminis TaxID=2894196 RepID=A0A9X1SHV6_9BACT|nr:FAD-dependent monooxygenase [Blastopirellula sediminis]MCC9606164.1 FAD-dependent monooxygenase [Blastopirellula sediminis]MCC9630537.1 FAD-dependent monooxygenase [Blastopirellula sediminis]